APHGAAESRALAKRRTGSTSAPVASPAAARKRRRSASARPARRLSATLSLRRAVDGLADAVVRTATTQVAVHGRVDFLIARRGLARKQRHRLHDLARLAIAALRHIL